MDIETVKKQVTKMETQTYRILTGLPKVCKMKVCMCLIGIKPIQFYNKNEANEPQIL